MTNIFDMVSGKWQHQRSSRAASALQYTDPSAVESLAVQLHTQAEAVSRYSSMPPDLAGVSVASFLKSQVTPT